MLTITRNVREPYMHIFLPIGYQIVRRVVHDLSLQELIGDGISIVSSSQKASSAVDKNGNTRLQSSNRIQCGLSINGNPRNQRWESWHHRRTTERVYKDTETGTTITEETHNSGLTLSCTLTLMKREDAYQAMDRINSMYDSGELYFKQDCSYNYPLHKDILGIIGVVNKMNEVPMSELVSRCAVYSDGAIGLVKNVERRNSSEVVVKRNLRDMTIGVELSTEEPEGVGANDNATMYQIQFELNTQFSRPLVNRIDYPIMVLNKLVPGEFVNSVYPKDSRTTNVNGPLLGNCDISTLTGEDLTRIDTVRLPWYDSWRIPCTSSFRAYGYKAVLIGAFTLENTDDPNGTTSIDLTDLGEITLSNDLLDMMREIGEDMRFPGKRVHLGIFSNNGMLHPEKITIIDGTTVVAPHRNFGNIHRIVLAVNKEINHGTCNFIRVGRFSINTVNSNK